VWAEVDEVEKSLFDPLPFSIELSNLQSLVAAADVAASNTLIRQL